MLFYYAFILFIVFNGFFLSLYSYLIIYFIYLVIYVSTVKSSVTFNFKNGFKYFSQKNISTIKIFINFFSNSMSLLLNNFHFKKFKLKPLFKRSSYFGIYRSNKNQ